LTIAPIEQHAMGSVRGPVRQNGWMNNRPVEPAAADDALLYILVGVAFTVARPIPLLAPMIRTVAIGSTFPIDYSARASRYIRVV
jgi:hypothetical protein